MSPDQQTFEQAAYAHYLAQHADGKTADKDEPPMTPYGLFWKQEDGTYGVLMFNAAWWGWQAARQQPTWQPIDTAPTDNKRRLLLARFDPDGDIIELDFDGIWEYWQESWRWMSAGGIHWPTHWAYQDAPLPATNSIAVCAISTGASA